MKPLPKTPQKVDPGKLVPVTTGDSDWGYLSYPFVVDDEGCTVRFAIEQKFYHLAATLPNYNALFSLLLVCWLNGNKVSLTYKLPVQGLIPPPDTNEPINLNIVSISAMPMSLS